MDSCSQPVPTSGKPWFYPEAQPIANSCGRSVPGGAHSSLVAPGLGFHGHTYRRGQDTKTRAKLGRSQDQIPTPTISNQGLHLKWVNWEEPGFHQVSSLVLGRAKTRLPRQCLTTAPCVGPGPAPHASQ